MRMNGFTLPLPSSSFAAIPGCRRSSSVRASRTVAAWTSRSAVPPVSVRSALGIRIFAIAAPLCSAHAGGTAAALTEPDDARLLRLAQIVEHEDRAGVRVIAVAKPDRERSGEPAD